ncbi:hypothetical protein EWM64_g6530 [Hericium alpestre]|uniref:AB hydrolase-1 domain-containing protein n=1 Tax=Hericium alpestre TaxID=135208 RepID=A0A4Y9ZTE0_9AGAM|nr:hypothetical protein EWM64_g6530 [Hericium alpestre]
MSSKLRPSGSLKKQLHSSDGCIIYAEATGNPLSPHVVLLHGMTLSGAVFDEFCQQQVLLHELYIPITPEAHTSKLYADDFIAVVHGFDLKRPVSVGWRVFLLSILNAAHIHSRSIRGLVLCDILEHVHPPPISGIVYLAATPTIAQFFAGSATPRLLSIISASSDPEQRPSVLRDFVDVCFVSDRGTAVPYTMRCTIAGMGALQPPEVPHSAFGRAQDPARRWAAVEACLPVRMLYGTGDAVMVGPEAEREVRRHATDVEVTVLEGFGHMVWWEAPAEIANAMVAFSRKMWRVLARALEFGVIIYSLA